MSIPVEVEALYETVARYGPKTFLLTTGADGRPHATHVVVKIDAAVLRCGIGRRTARNATEQPLVSFLWPPTEPGGYSLIVDGEMLIERADDEPVGVITATKAVLHRSALSARAEDAACGSVDATSSRRSRFRSGDWAPTRSTSTRSISRIAQRLPTRPWARSTT